VDLSVHVLWDLLVFLGIIYVIRIYVNISMIYLNLGIHGYRGYAEEVRWDSEDPTGGQTDLRQEERYYATAGHYLYWVYVFYVGHIDKIMKPFSMLYS
jgi:hypothetical protein